MKKMIFLLLGILWLTVSHAGVSFAGSLTVGWDSISDATYYVVYWRDTITPSVISSSANIDKSVLQYQVTNLTEGSVYEFSIKAFNSCGNSSDYSDWIKGSVPAASIPSPTPPPADNTGQQLLDLVLNPPSDTGGSTGNTSPVSVLVNPDPQNTTTTTDNAQEKPYPIMVDIPGAKSTDGFEPPIQAIVVDNLSENPTIEVSDSHLMHLRWLKSGWGDYNNLNGEARIATGDINGDGKDEIIIGLGSITNNTKIPGGFFEVLNNDYTHLAWGRIEWADYNEINGETFPAVGDIDGDGKAEIVVGLGKYGKGYMEVFGWDNGQIAHKSWLKLQWPEYNDLKGEVRPVCTDINNDGKDEVIAGLGTIGGNADIPGGKFEVFQFISGAWNHLMWGFVDWPEYSSVNGETWPAAGDIDGDGNVELIIGLGKGGQGQMSVFKFENGQALQLDWVQVSWPEYNDVSGETRPVCGDVNNDGKDEVILGWNTKTGTTAGGNYYKVLSYNTSAKGWENYKDAKSSTASIDSVPVKGVVNNEQKIIVGIGKSVNTSSSTQTSSYTPPGAEGGGKGCFITTLSY